MNFKVLSTTPINYVDEEGLPVEMAQMQVAADLLQTRAILHLAHLYHIQHMVEFTDQENKVLLIARKGMSDSVDDMLRILGEVE